jgi:hypothetical protein
MGKLGNSAEALVEILTLCEQTLRALKADYGNSIRANPSDQNRRQERRRFTNMVLIRGGLSRTDSQLSVR